MAGATADLQAVAGLGFGKFIRELPTDDFAPYTLD